MSFLTMDVLSVIYMVLMGVALFVYVILDGFDLGVGMLFPFGKDRAQRDEMIATVDPFWDANETWLVLIIGVIFIGFPAAYGLILTSVYMFVVLMLIGLIFRGAAFDFRAKAATEISRNRWDKVFAFGSYLASFSQGTMIGFYVTGLEESTAAWIFAIFVGIVVCIGYTLIGSTWILFKSEKELRSRALIWIKKTAILSIALLILICIASPIVVPEIAEKWSSTLSIIVLAVLLVAALLFAGILFKTLPKIKESGSHSKDWVPYVCVVAIIAFAIIALMYTLFPWVVLGQMKIWDVANAQNSLIFVLVGALLMLPIILGYTFYVHFLFRGKTLPTDHY